MKGSQSPKLTAGRRLLAYLYPEYAKSAHRVPAREVYRMLLERDYIWSSQWGAWLYQRPLPGFEVVMR